MSPFRPAALRLAGPRLPESCPPALRAPARRLPRLCLLARLALVLVPLLSACEGDRAAVPPAERSGSRLAGQELLLHYGCVACHRIRGMAELDGQSGPALERIAYRNYLGGVVPNTEDNMVRWIMHPRQLSPGTAMPELGVSAAEARDMAAYLYQQVPP